MVYMAVPDIERDIKLNTSNLLLKYHSLIIYSHQGRVDLDKASRIADIIARYSNRPVLVYEYPGYGPFHNWSKKEFPSIDGCNDTLMKLIRYLNRKKGILLEQMFLFGHGVGTGPVCYVAKELSKDPAGRLGGIFLLSPFLSLKEILTDRIQNEWYSWQQSCMGWIRYFVPHGWNNASCVRSLSRSMVLSLFVAEKDEEIYPVHAKRLYDLASCRKCLSVLKNAQHDDIPFDEVGERMYTLLNKLNEEKTKQLIHQT